MNGNINLYDGVVYRLKPDGHFKNISNEIILCISNVLIRKENGIIPLDKTGEGNHISRNASTWASIFKLTDIV